MLFHGLAAGVFVGNLLFHWYMGNFWKGLAIGSIAAVLVELWGLAILLLK